MAEKRLSELADRLEKVASKLENISIKGKAGGGAAANGKYIVHTCTYMHQVYNVITVLVSI